MDHSKTSTSVKRPILVGDIGGSNARLSIQKISDVYHGEVDEVKTEILSSPDFKDIKTLLKTFLKQFEGTENYPFIAVIGICGPIVDNSFSIIANLTWPKATGEELAKELNLKEFYFLNDMESIG